MSYLTDKGQMFICFCVLKLSDIRARQLLGCDHESAGGRPGQPGPRLGLHLRGGSPLRSLPRGLRLGRRHRRLPGGGLPKLLSFFNFYIDTTYYILHRPTNTASAFFELNN